MKKITTFNIDEENLEYLLVKSAELGRSVSWIVNEYITLAREQEEAKLKK